MNKFVLLVCASVLLGCTNARPDLSLGYRYHQGHSSGGGAFLQAPGAVSPSASSYSPTASGSSYFNAQPSLGQVGNSGFVGSTQLGYGGNGNSNGNGFTTNGFSQNFGKTGYTTGSTGSYDSNSLINSGSSFTQTTTTNSQDEQEAFLSHLQNHQAPIITKNFYVHSAPVDHDEQQIVRYINIGRPQKNYRVVFIDAPSSTNNKAKIIANVAPTEEKTAIYVLSKKSNALDVSAEVVTPAPVNNKPEVFFVKYKTPEEAIHAQHTIQAQYDSLGGSSNVSNEGPIPVSSVIGSLDGSGSASETSGVTFSSGANVSDSDDYVTPVQIKHTGINTQQTYLPASSHK